MKVRKDSILENQPVTATSLPLPSGAATETTLDAIKTAVEILDNIVSGSEAQVDIVSSALPTGAATETTLDAVKTAVELLDNAISGSEMQVDVVSGVQTDGLTDTELRATAVPVSGTVTANLSATDNAVLDTIDAVLDAIKIDTEAIETAVEGTLSVDASGTAVPVTDNGGSLTIDGTVTANLSATDNAVLDTIDAVLDQIKIDTEAIETAVEGTLIVDGSGVTQPVSGTVTANLSATDNTVLDNIDTNTAIPSAMVAFVTDIPTAGTRVQLASNSIKGCVIQAPSTNTGNVYIGGSDVSSTVFGAELQPGQSTGWGGSNTNAIWIDAATSGDDVAVIGA